VFSFTKENATWGSDKNEEGTNQTGVYNYGSRIKGKQGGASECAPRHPEEYMGWRVLNIGGGGEEIEDERRDNSFFERISWMTGRLGGELINCHGNL